METANDRFLSTVDRLSRHVGPLNRLIAGIADRLVPQATARAGTCVPPGYQLCSQQCVASLACCQPLGNHQELINVYAINIASCSSGNVAKCSDGCHTATCPLC